MLELLHNFTPDPVLLRLGPVTIYWYGLFVVSGILLAVLVMFQLAGKYSLDRESVIDLAFWLILGGLAGARLYHVLLELPYYLARPAEIFLVWQGGLAIHGGLFAGALILWLYSRRFGQSFWLLGSLIVPGIALAQALGRWGNYFNQEIYGRPTSLPWGIPIEPINRISEYYNSAFFHPTFLYESLGSLLIFFVLLYGHYLFWEKGREKHQYIVLAYFLLYSILRFLLEFVRIDSTPAIMGLRWPQWVSLGLIIAVLAYYRISRARGLKKTGDNAKLS